MATLADLSIIIPAYNAAHFLPRTLQSLAVAGANAACEVIVIDNGSSDDTANAALRCVELLPRLRVVSQANRGPGGARNHGLALSQGRYVHFVDADDTLVENAYRTLEPALRAEPSLVDFDYWEENNRGRMKRRTSIPEFAIENDVASEAAVLTYGSLFTKLIRRDLAERVPFPESCLYEDGPVVGVLPFLGTPVVKVDEALYVYRHNGLSITRSFSMKQLTDRRGMANAYRENCRLLDIDRRFPHAVEMRHFRMYARAIWKAILKTGHPNRHTQVAAHSAHVRALFPRIEENPFFQRLSRRQRLGFRLLMSPEARFLRLAELLIARR